MSGSSSPRSTRTTSSRAPERGAVDGGLYREGAPRPSLRAAVACVWRREAPPGGRSRVLPDGCVDLVWTSDAGPFVAGPDTGAALRQLGAGFEATGLRLRTGFAAAALGVPATELRDARVPLADVWGRRGAELEERLGEATGHDERRQLLEAAVAARLGDVDAPDPVVLAAIAALGRPGARVSEVAARLPLSERQLRRRFHESVGYGPKTLERVLRFQRFLRSSEGDLSRRAADAGYADQAHLTRACVELSGLSPSRLLAGGA
jgi:AraC-like DNA-binding protein